MLTTIIFVVLLLVGLFCLWTLYKRDIRKIDEKFDSLKSALNSRDHVQLDKWLAAYGTTTPWHILRDIKSLRDEFFQAHTE